MAILPHAPSPILSPHHLRTSSELQCSSSAHGIHAARVVSGFGRVVISVSGFPFMFVLGCAFACAFAFGPVDILLMVAVASVVTRLAVAVDILGVQVVRLQMKTYLVSRPLSLLLLTWAGCWDGQRRTMVVVIGRRHA